MCRNFGKYGHEAVDCWYKQPPKPQGKGKGTEKSKSKVTEIRQIDSSKQVEETWTPNTSAPPSGLSSVNTIGCADDGFSLKDRFWTCLPTLVCTAIPNGEFYKWSANDVALHHYGQKVVCGHVTTNSGRRILIQITLDVMNVRTRLLSISAQTSGRHNHLQSRL